MANRSNNKEGPTVIALTRQNFLCEKKVQVKIFRIWSLWIKSNSKKPHVSIYASGSGVEIASELMEILTKKNYIAHNLFHVLNSCLKIVLQKPYLETKSKYFNWSGSSMGWNEVCPNNLIMLVLRSLALVFI